MKKNRHNKTKNHSFMKKKLTLIPVLLFFSLLSMPIFSSCDKDTNCYLTVLVRDDATHAPIPLANVKVSQDGGSLQAEGITGVDGTFQTVFSAPAIVKVKAILPQPDGIGERRGETSIRLKEGETVTATITMTSEIQY